MKGATRFDDVEGDNGVIPALLVHLGLHRGELHAQNVFIGCRPGE